jgi:hypothetical protein
MQVEPIINARFKQFRTLNDLSNTKDGLAFERFVNYTIFSHHQDDAFSADSELMEVVSVGGANDLSIDGIAIKVNGIIVKNKEDIDQILDVHRKISIEFLFIQSKYKDKFELHELQTFLNGIEDFLSNIPAFPTNDKIKKMLELKEYLFEESIILSWKNSPCIKSYYTTVAKWNNSPHLIAAVEQFRRRLNQSNSYEEIDVAFIDNAILKKFGDEIENVFKVSLSCNQIMPLNSVDGVSNSCISLIYGSEFMKIIASDNGGIRKNLFNDNVRDYQGENSVNAEINNTIVSNPAKFALLNNGVTIVCEEFQQFNNKLTISSPQIVNGCQTSHVVYNAFKAGIDIQNLPISVKIISTKSLEISNEIVKGANRQNIVMEEAFEGTRQFHKDLEQFFAALATSNEQILYERRSKQYGYNPSIKQRNKITLKVLTQYFVGMFLNKPHMSHRHESILLKELRQALYQDNHSKLMYYTSSLTFSNLELRVRDGRLAKKYQSYKAQLMMMMRQAIAGDCPVLQRERAIDEHCNSILHVIRNENLFDSLLADLAHLFDEARDKWIDEMKKSQFGLKDNADYTTLLLELVKNKYDNQSSDFSDEEQHFHTGFVRKTIVDKNGQKCGFIDMADNQSVFFHSSQNPSVNFESIAGQSVIFRIGTSPKTLKTYATDVELVPHNLG